ncbi:MAG: hypothetical protein PGN16_04165 [Sphingomonas phyllosphaerae]|uniref:hypothetical protein n=1 Tax=Sphingomonas phyllosphaerae TaxID=257003 RepID=UPI002FFC63C9
MDDIGLSPYTEVRMRPLFATACLFWVASCQYVPGTDASFIRNARASVSDKLIDPTSPLWRKERIIKSETADFRNGAQVTKPGDPKFVCGEVNGKNQMGAFVGFSPYAYDLVNKQSYLLPSFDNTNEAAMAILNFPTACMTKSQLPNV